MQETSTIASSAGEEWRWKEEGRCRERNVCSNNGEYAILEFVGI
jgi:hypothetical protein